jgi:putative nucleotidyltransferase with HDIG domain
MRRVNTSALIPGMVTAEDVFNYNNHLILPKGLILTDKAITKLEFYSIIYVRIEDEVIETPETQVKEDTSYSERLRLSPEFQHFKEEFTKETEHFKDVIDNFVGDNGELDADQLVEHALSLLSSENKYVNVFDMLHSMRQLDDATYVHCMNVGLICNIFAHWLRMDEEEIRTATLSGLLHDIGKIKMPEKILKKPGKLTAWEFGVVKTHPKESYKMLEKHPLNIHIKNAALMHHERCDGSGYPLGLTSDSIDPYAKMVAIADVYDAMTSARVYRGPLCPFKVIETFENEGFQKYDSKYILPFLENIVDTYLLHDVRLTNGESGKIVYINPHKLSKPTIKVGDKYINLSQEPHLFIDAIL